MTTAERRQLRVPPAGLWICRVGECRKRKDNSCCRHCPEGGCNGHCNWKDDPDCMLMRRQKEVV